MWVIIRKITAASTTIFIPKLVQPHIVNFILPMKTPANHFINQLDHQPCFFNNSAEHLLFKYRAKYDRVGELIET